MSFNFLDIQISDVVIKKVRKYKLENQFKKVIWYIRDGKLKTVRFKLRQPKSKWIYYFRINKQYRAWGKVKGKVLYVFDIDDHS